MEANEWTGVVRGGEGVEKVMTILDYHEQQKRGPDGKLPEHWSIWWIANILEIKISLVTAKKNWKPSPPHWSSKHAGTGKELKKKCLIGAKFRCPLIGRINSGMFWSDGASFCSSRWEDVNFGMLRSEDISFWIIRSENVKFGIPESGKIGNQWILFQLSTIMHWMKSWWWPSGRSICDD